jgi:hypothetical protein
MNKPYLGPCDTWCTTDVNLGWGCGDNKDNLCVNPCKNADFPYYSLKSRVCYSTKELADVGAGACDTWCTTDIKYGTGCGDAIVKLCDNPCRNPDFSYPNVNTDLCYKTKVLADKGGYSDCDSWCTNDLSIG